MSLFGVGSLACYESLDQVGEGTYGYVYRARDRRSGETVALKRLILHRESAGFPLCAVREIKFLKSLNHKNIVSLKDVVTSKGCDHLEIPLKPEQILKHEQQRGPANNTVASSAIKNEETEDDGCDILKLCGNLYFVFEYMDHDLGGLIDAKYKFSNRLIKCIMKQLFEVLDFLQEKRVVHRDIKTSNILISNRNQVKLADFGLARSLQSSDGRDVKLDLTNNVITLWYRPPELLLGVTRYSTAVDMWSAGCVMAELELGRALFPGKTELEQIELIFRTIGSTSEELWPGVSKLPNYDSLVKNMPKYASTMEYSYGTRLAEPAMNLLERLLIADPAKRMSAKGALSNKYFLSQPTPPANPMDMEPLMIGKGESYHEYKTKLIRKQKEEAEAAANTTATAAAPSSTSVSIAQHQHALSGAGAVAALASSNHSSLPRKRPYDLV